MAGSVGSTSTECRPEHETARSMRAVSPKDLILRNVPIEKTVIVGRFPTKLKVFIVMAKNRPLIFDLWWRLQADCAIIIRE